VIALMPAIAFADGESPGENLVVEPISQTGTVVAKIGDVEFIDLQEAVNTAQAGDTITLLTDVTLEETVNITATTKVTLDLNGHTIDFNQDEWVYGAANSGTALLTVGFGGDLTIEDSSAEQTGTIDGSANVKDVYGAVMMTAKGDDPANGTAKLTVNGGTLKGGYAAIAGNKDRDNTEIVINSGKITVGISDSYSTAGIEHPMNGRLTINGGIIEGMDGISFRSGTLLITGGEIIGNAPEGTFEEDGYWDNDFGACTGHALQIVSRANSNPANETPSVSITGGTFTSANTDAVGSYAGYKGEEPDTQIIEFISGGNYNTNPKVLSATGKAIYLKTDDSRYYVGSAPSHSANKNTWVEKDGINEETYVEPYYPPVVIDPTPVTPAPSTPKDDVVTNETTNTGAAGETVVAPTTNADVSASTTTTKTETGEAKTETKVEQTTADKIVENAVANKSEEVVIDATTAPAPTTGTTTPAAETTEAAVTIPTATIETIAEQTEAAVTIKTDVAEIKLDNTAAAAIAEQAAEDGTISIVAVKTDEKVVEEETVTGETEKVTEVHFELKVVCSERGVIGDFKGGTVTVTVPVPEDMHTEELVAVYIDAQGHYHRVTGVKNANGTFTFTTDHFSSYAVMTAEEAEKAIAEQKAKVESVKLKLRSANSKTSKGKKAIKLTVSEVTDTGIDFDGYVIYRSTKKTSGFKKIYTTKTGTYYNTSAKKGVKYYYKAKGFVTIDGEKVYTDWSLKAIRTAK